MACKLNCIASPHEAFAPAGQESSGCGIASMQRTPILVGEGQVMDACFTNEFSYYIWPRSFTGQGTKSGRRERGVLGTARFEGRQPNLWP
jgi:hypothetical protein